MTSYIGSELGLGPWARPLLWAQVCTGLGGCISWELRLPDLINPTLKLHSIPSGVLAPNPWPPRVGQPGPSDSDVGPRRSGLQFLCLKSTDDKPSPLGPGDEAIQSILVGLEVFFTSFGVSPSTYLPHPPPLASAHYP